MSSYPKGAKLGSWCHWGNERPGDPLGGGGVHWFKIKSGTQRTPSDLSSLSRLMT